MLYSDLAIETCLTLRLIYHLPLRQTEGFVVSIFGQAHLELPVPDSSTLCRRSKTLAVELKTKSAKPATDIVLDATGLKVFGKGEWKVRKHGYCKHRTWMKLHVALDPQDQQAWAVELSTSSVDDAQMVKPLLQAVPCPINSVTGDGAYDKVKVREQLCRRAAEQKEDILQLMGLQKNAIPDVKLRDCTRQRDEDIKAIRHQDPEPDARDRQTKE